MNIYSLESIGKAFSEELRIRILYYVYSHPECTNKQVELYFSITQAKASRHLKYLSDSGITSQKRFGTTTMNKANDEFISIIEHLFSLVDKQELSNPVVEQVYR